MIAPSALAVHGEAYDAYGTATLGDPTTGNAQVFLAAVHWTGYNYQPSEQFTVIIKDLTGNVVVNDVFHGCWTANGPVFYSTELLAYHAWAAASTGSCFPGDSARFDITGFQYQVVSGGGPDKAIMFYEGAYRGYALDLVVPYTVPVPV
jgi:hypothetical protein